MKPRPVADAPSASVRSLALACLLFPLASALQAAAPAPLLRLAFDEGSGNSAADTGKADEPSVAAMLKGDATWTRETPLGGGAALSLSGNNGSYAALPSAKVQGLVQFTLTFWVNFRAVPPINDRLLSSFKNREGLDLRVSNVNEATGQVALALDVNDSIAHGSSGINAIGGWVFVAITYDGTATTHNVRYYTAEPQGALSPAGKGSSAGGEVRGLAELQIGGTPSNPSRTPAAWIDDLRIYPGILDLATLEKISR